MRKVQATDRRACVVLQVDVEVRERQEFDMIQFVELLAPVFALGFVAARSRCCQREYEGFQ
jgi:hypothetical protein